MTTFLKEFKEIKSVQKNAKTYVYLDMGNAEADYQFVLLSDLRIAVNDSTVRPVKSIKEMKEAINDGSLYQKVGAVELARHVRRTTHNLDAKIYMKTVEMPNQYISTIYQSDESTAQEVPNGLNRVLEVKRQAGFSGSYVYCKLAGDKDMRFYHVSEIGYVEDGRFVSLADLGDTVDPDMLDNKVIFNQRENKIVEAIFADASCNFGKILNQEKVDAKNLTKTSFEYDKDGNVKAVEEQVDARYSEQVYRKTNNGAVLDTYNYQISAGQRGQYIKVEYEGHMVETLVSLDSLHYVDDFGNAGDAIDERTLRGDKRFELIGKQVYVQLQDANGNITSQITKPLTMDQLAFNYNKLMSMQETTEKEDALTEDAYLKLANGRYIKEQAVAHPICFDFVKNNTNDFDAFYVVVNTSEGEKSVIVDKNAFDKTMSFVKDGMKLELTNAYKVKRSNKEMKYCDIIQTTKTSANVQECVALAEPRYDNNELIVERKNAEDNAQAVADAQTNFEEKYKKGEYTLDEVLDDNGEWVRLKDNKRYLYSDHITLPDYSRNSPEYKFFTEQGMTFDGNKLVGGKPFDAKKANKKAFKTYKDVVLGGIGFIFTKGGVITTALLGALIVNAFALPAALVTGIMTGVIIGAPIVAAVAIPVVNAIRSAVYNHKKYKFEKKLKLQRKELTKEIFKDFEFIYEETKLASKENRLNANLMLNNFEDVEQKIYSMAETKLFSDFRMVNGKGKVDETNAELFSQYRVEMLDLEKEIKRLERRAKRNPEAKAELDIKKAQYQQNIRNYISQGVIEPKDKNMKDLIDTSNILKGCMLKRYYSGELSEQEKIALDSVYRVRVKDAKGYDVNEQSKKGLDLIEECRRLGANTHYDYEKNLVDSPKYEQVEEEVIAKEETHNLVKTEEKSFNIKGAHEQKSKYYEALGVSKDAGVDEIRSAYLKLAKQYREDASKIIEINSAKEFFIKQFGKEAWAKRKETGKEKELTTEERKAIADKPSVKPVEKPKDEKITGVKETTPVIKKKVEQKVEKKRLSPKNLEKLLRDIKELRALDKTYYGPDEAIPANIDKLIAAKEAEIRPSVHMLKSCVNKENYAEYKEAVIRAAKDMKLHKAFMNKTEKINIGKIEI